MKGVKRTICGYFLNHFILLKNQILIQGPILDIFGEVAVWLKRAPYPHPQLCNEPEGKAVSSV
jgi:hypothetical protein